MSGVPVVLVHGFLATATTMLPLRWRLEKRGLQVFATELSPLCIQRVETLAAELDRTIYRVKRETGAERVDVIGVSQGGVLALYWAHAHRGWPHVRRFVAVGAPVGGSWAAAVGLPLLGAISGGIWQLLPGSAFTRELQTRLLPPDADVVTLTLRGDPVSPPEKCWITGAANHVFDGPRGPLKHQWLIFSQPLVQALLDVIEAP